MSSPVRTLAGVITTGALLGAAVGATFADPAGWRWEWPRTDFSKHNVSFAEIKSGGPPKDGIPAIDAPRFEQLVGSKPTGWSAGLGDTEPVIDLSVRDDPRAYPLRILIWHEITNDVVGGMPVAVTYCPLCNAALVFDRTVDGRALDFGTTGKLRLSDLVMYDRQTELVAAIHRGSRCRYPNRTAAAAHSFATGIVRAISASLPGGPSARPERPKCAQLWTQSLYWLRRDGPTALAL